MAKSKMLLEYCWWKSQSSVSDSYTHADDDHKASKFLQNVHLDDVGLVLKVLTGCSFLELENIDVSWLNAVKLKEMQESFSCGQQVVLFFFY